MQKVAPLTLKEFWRLWRKEERRERFEIKCAPAKATQAVRRAIERKRDLLDRLRVAGIDASSTLLPPPAHK